MNWTELKIFTTSEGIELLTFKLLGLGINGFVVDDPIDFDAFLEEKSGNWDYIDNDLMSKRSSETSMTVYLPEDSQGADTLLAIREMLDDMRKSDSDSKLGRLVAELQSVCEEDWANNWKQYFKPFPIGERLYIKPSWENADNAENRTILEIDPASSFGTGQHHTTRLCLELLEKNVEPSQRILDLGCGSGILAIAAALLGAGECRAVDISQNAVETALKNAEKNGVSSVMTGYCGNVLTDPELVEKLGTNYDIIAANIVADVLIAMSDLFKSFLKPAGKLVASGIIAERADEVSTALCEAGFKQLEYKEREGWVALLLQNIDKNIRINFYG